MIFISNQTLQCYICFMRNFSRFFCMIVSFSVVFLKGETFSMFHYIMSLYSPLFTSWVVIHEEMILQTWSYAYVKLTIKKEMTYSTKNTLSSPAATNIHSLMIMFFEGWPNKRLEVITNNSWMWFFKLDIIWHLMSYK